MKRKAVRIPFFWRMIMELLKVRVSLLASLSAAVGFLMSGRNDSLGVLVPSAGIFLLACGAAALNQIQEVREDALMERTKDRPIPSGYITPRQAGLISFFLILSGGAVLFFGSGLITVLFGFFAVLWYNGIYTALKRKTMFAVFIGAVTGSIPPIIGWVHGGGSLMDPRMLLLALILFIWQVPHFWLILLKHRGDYEKTGFASPTKVFNTEQLSRMIYVWVCATAVSSLLIPLYGLIQYQLSWIGLSCACLWLIWSGKRLVYVSEKSTLYHLSFRGINSYGLFIMILLSLDRLWSHGI